MTVSRRRRAASGLRSGRYRVGPFSIPIIRQVLAGCGYKPVSKITNDIMGEHVYVNVLISKEEPKNSVWIKDSVFKDMLL